MAPARSNLVNVTDQVATFGPDEDLVAVQRCVCGHEYEFVVARGYHGSNSRRKMIDHVVEDAEPMPCCGRRLVAKMRVGVFEVREP